MITKFNIFNPTEIKNNEISYFEKELISRKKMREEMFLNQYSFDDIKSFIINEIKNDSQYYLTTGKRNNNNISEHIEYISENIGKVLIFKPHDDSNIGSFEINGKTYQTDANEIRNFYHFLIQRIKK